MKFAYIILSYFMIEKKREKDGQHSRDAGHR